MKKIDHTHWGTWIVLVSWIIAFIYGHYLQDQALDKIVELIKDIP